MDPSAHYADLDIVPTADGAVKSKRDASVVYAEILAPPIPPIQVIPATGDLLACRYSNKVILKPLSCVVPCTPSSPPPLPPPPGPKGMIKNRLSSQRLKRQKKGRKVHIQPG